jgi:hypothetical protein
MNQISLAAAAAATTAVILSPGGAKATTLSVTHHCDANTGGVLPFTWHYKATITGGNFVVDWVSPGGAEVPIRGTIPPNGGEPVLQLTGTTGNSKFTTDMLPHGLPVSFPIVATFALHRALLERGIAMIRYASANLHFSDDEKTILRRPP